jgi:hypothetical protein
MTTAFITRYSSEMECDYTTITQDISRDFIPPHPDDHSGKGIATDSFIFADALLMGDIYLTQNAETVRLTINHRNGLQIDLTVNKATNEVGYLIRDPHKDIDMDIDLPQEAVDAILVMINNVMEKPL